MPPKPFQAAAAASAATSAATDKECRYCHYTGVEAVAKCLDCNRWFCNARVGSRRKTHLISHMLTRGHRQIALHPESPHGGTRLECYRCGKSNLFALGLVVSDGRAFMLCREPCLLDVSPGARAPTLPPPPGVTYKELPQEAVAACKDWRPLVVDGAVMPELLAEPAVHEHANDPNVRTVTTDQIEGLEARWRTTGKNSAAADRIDLADLPESRRKLLGLLPPLLDRYPRGDDYRFAFREAIEAEANESRDRSDNMLLDGLTVRWTFSSSSTGERCVAQVNCPNYESLARSRSREVVLMHEPTRWEGIAYVRYVVGDTVVCDLRQPDGVPDNEVDGFRLKLGFNDVTFMRMMKAVNRLVAESASVDDTIYKVLMGFAVTDLSLPVPPRLPASSRALSPPETKVLNEPQVEAVRTALTSRFALIHGPPGTGKTTTSVAIIYHIAHVQKRRVLLTAPSNTAVDELALRVIDTGVTNVLRVVSATIELGPMGYSPDAPLHESYLHVKVFRQLRHNATFMELHNRRLAGERLADKEFKRYRELCETVELPLMCAAQVVAVTCCSAGSRRFEGPPGQIAPNVSFDAVLVDEATQCVEPEALIPLTLGVQQAILVGDHCQLGPVVTSSRAKRAGFERSLFERLVALKNVEPHMLSIQFRMHPAISAFSNRYFYSSRLVDGVTAAQRADGGHRFPWPNRAAPVAFVATSSAEEHAASGSSQLNRGEADIAVNAVRYLLSSNASRGQIAVITPYTGQRTLITDLLQRLDLLPRPQLPSSTPSTPTTPTAPDLSNEIEVASVDQFQGREKDYIIISCVRSSDRQGIGFLAHWQRLNVALTRARCGLIVIGDFARLSKNVLWHALGRFGQDKSYFVDASFRPLKAAAVALNAAPVIEGWQHLPVELRVYHTDVTGELQSEDD